MMLPSIACTFYAHLQQYQIGLNKGKYRGGCRYYYSWLVTIESPNRTRVEPLTIGFKAFFVM
jgi:hypothetical protein